MNMEIKSAVREVTFALRAVTVSLRDCTLSSVVVAADTKAAHKQRQLAVIETPIFIIVSLNECTELLSSLLLYVGHCK